MNQEINVLPGPAMHRRLWPAARNLLSAKKDAAKGQNRSSAKKTENKRYGSDDIAAEGFLQLSNISSD